MGMIQLEWKWRFRCCYVYLVATWSLDRIAIFANSQWRLFMAPMYVSGSNLITSIRGPRDKNGSWS